MKLHRAVLLGFGLKELKITLNIMKLRHAGFAKIGVKRGENSSKHCESWSARLSIKWASKSMIKFKFQEIGQK